MVKKIITIATLVIMMSCNRICDCVYYSEEREYGNTYWIITHQENWDGCDDVDFGYSYHFYPNGLRIEEHSYVICD
jgi:hypothetical protein